MWEEDIEFLGQETDSLQDISAQHFNTDLKTERRLCGRCWCSVSGVMRRQFCGFSFQKAFYLRGALPAEDRSC